MKSKSKVLSVFAVGAVAALALSACSSPAATTDAGADKAYKISFIQGVVGDEFYITMQCGIEEEAAKSGTTIDIQGPAKWDATLQKPIVDSVAASKPDAILIAPNDVTAMEASLRAAADAGIKIIMVDTTLTDASFAVSEISSDNVGGGAEAFKAMQTLHPEGGKLLVISTDPGISTVDARIEGFQKAAEADPLFNYVGVQYSHNEPSTAAQLVTAALAKDPDIIGIFATNLFSAEGTATGVRQAGKDGQVSIVGFDAGPAQIKQLQDGVVQALIAQQPGVIGSNGVQQALAALNGTEVTKKIQTGFQVITKENLDSAGADYIYKSTC